MTSRRSFFALIGLGAVAQLAEPLFRKQTVFGSIPNGTSIPIIDAEEIARTVEIPGWGQMDDYLLNRISPSAPPNFFKDTPIPAREIVDFFDQNEGGIVNRWEAYRKSKDGNA